MIAIRRIASRAINLAVLLAAIALAIPAMMLVSFYIFVGIGEYTGWYNPSHYYSMSPN